MLERIILDIISEIEEECFTTADVLRILKLKYPRVYREIYEKYGRSRYSFKCYVASMLRALVAKGLLTRGKSTCKGKRGFRRVPKNVDWSSPCIAEWCKVAYDILKYLHK